MNQPCRGLLFAPGELRRQFDRDRGFALRHDLAGHPLLTLEALADLATRLPTRLVEYNHGDLAVNQDPARTPGNGLSAKDTVEQIATCHSWMVLKDIEHVPDYKALLDGCLDRVREELGPLAEGMADRHGFIFVSSPGAVTPYHLDFEQNFLMQIQGRKYMTVFNDQDRFLLPEERRELALQGVPRNLEYRPEFASHGLTYEMEPGDAVNVPLTSPHWVKVGEQVSISFSITFQTRHSERIRLAHGMNSKLRLRGLQPTAVGRYPLLDDAKVFSYKALRRLGLIGTTRRPA